MGITDNILKNYTAHFQYHFEYIKKYNLRILNL